MKFTHLAIAAAFLVQSTSANVRGEDHDLEPYLRQSRRSMQMKGDMGLRRKLMRDKNKKSKKSKGPSPTGQPIAAPSASPRSAPTISPSSSPSTEPSASPSTSPSGQPIAAPSASPSTLPSAVPSSPPTVLPTPNRVGNPALYRGVMRMRIIPISILWYRSG
jgi:hypothetical protein